MTNPETEILPEEPVETPAEAAAPAAPPPFDARRRLRELLSVPERDRSDEVWDEIIELEIQLAPGNRVAGNEGGGNPGRSNQPGGQGRPGGGGAQKKPQQHRPRTANNRRGRQGKPPGGGGNPAAS